LASWNLFEDRVGHGRGCLVFAKQENPTFVFLFFHFTSFHFYFFYFLNMNATQAAKIAPRISPWAK